MIDNIQVIVKSIHIRFESEHNIISPHHTFAFGVTLDKLDIFTTNLNWEKTFVDHSAQGHLKSPQ